MRGMTFAVGGWIGIKRGLVATFLGLALLVEVGVAQAPVDREARTFFAGRHQLRLALGFGGVTGSASASVGEGARVESRIQFGSTVGYRYWVREGWAIGADAGLMSMDQEVTASSQSVSVVSSTLGIAVLVVRAEPPSWTLGDRVRPFGELAFGAFGAMTSSVEAIPPSVAADDQTVPGLRAGLGLDLPLGSRFLAGLGAYYTLLPDFDEPIAGRDNFSSWVVEAAFGILLGG